MEVSILHYYYHNIILPLRTALEKMLFYVAHGPD